MQHYHFQNYLEIEVEPQDGDKRKELEQWNVL